MNSETKSCCGCTAKLAYGIAVLGAILIVAFLDHELKMRTQAPPVDEGRAEERANDMADIHHTEDEALNNTGWIDPSKGIVRLRIEDAMNLMVQTWGANSAAGRSNMLERVAKAYPPPAPPKPQKPTEFE